ncbi:amidase signature enzyme [Dendrothele bispora CBS 962.96]|uniref:Amidase signature enzyme n=1 Tax=Dendrothele bispora (strain CBS 962.96) TaxID=1314807 RepID=A0A4S8LBA8_DENBC|nr:amidase signature enzyme [Dendrothele bispora CBS 962.96]
MGAWKTVLRIWTTASVVCGSAFSKAFVASVSRTIILDEAPYYLPAEPVLVLPGLVSFDTGILPFTVLPSLGGGKSIQALSDDWIAIDDVFSNGFMQAVMFQQPFSTLSQSTIGFLRDQAITVLTNNASSSLSLPTLHLPGIDSLAPGPYVLAPDQTGKSAVYTPLRLHFDPSQSFYKSTTRKSDGSFNVVSASLDTDSSPYIGVPSRIYDLDAKEKPLAGLRVSVKDIYFLKGIAASAGNRAFYATYGVRNVTGPALSRLLDLGAHVVGTTKTVQFANGDRATGDWVDYHASFCPRADGNQEPSGSSTGAGTSISTLDWLDISIGTDTGGSIRGPASANGVYGIRPSVGAISLDDVVPLSPVMDTSGYMSRSPKLFSKFGKEWYAETFQSYPSFPKTLLMSTDFDVISRPAMDVYNGFVDKLQGFLGGNSSGVSVTREFSISALWNQTSGVGLPVQLFANATYPTLIAFYQWNNVGVPLFKDYAALNGGRNPHINPQVKFRWEFGESQGIEDYNRELERRETYENWTMSNLLLPDAESCSGSIYMYPINAGTYSSRELYTDGSPAIPFGFSSGRASSLARLPEVVIPIGQIPFNSTISGIEEQLPVSISLVASRNCDFMLLDLVDKLADEGIVKEVKTGRTAF